MLNSINLMKIMFLGAFVLMGGAIGLYLATDFDGPSFLPSTCCTKEPELKQIKFPLTDYDSKETQEGPRLTVNSKGKLFMAWASQFSDTEKKVFLVSSEDGGDSFNSPVEVVKSGIFKAVSQMKGKTISRDVRMNPHLLTYKNDIILAWTEALPDLTGVKMLTSSSQDNGITFSKPIAVHQGENARATFSSFSIGQDGTLACSWLDNREKYQTPFASLKLPNAESFLPEEQISKGEEGKGVCPCCPTCCLVAPDGTLYIAYRNIQNGHRDIFIATKKPAQKGFQEPLPVISPTWKFDGCPHDGPSMVFAGNTLHITWMDARTGSHRCYHAFANSSDMKFTTSELHPIIQGSQGNAKLVLDAKGDVHAVWEESKDATSSVDPSSEHKHSAQDFSSNVARNIMVGTFDKTTNKMSLIKPVDQKSGVFQTRPALAVAQDGDLFIAWNELSEAGKAIKFKKVRSGSIVAKESNQ